MYLLTFTIQHYICTEYNLLYILRLTRCFFFFELPIQKITYVAWWESKNIIYFLEKHNELYLLMMSPKYFRSASEIFLLLKYLALESVLQIYQKIKMYWTKIAFFINTDRLWSVCSSQMQRNDSCLGRWIQGNKVIVQKYLNDDNAKIINFMGMMVNIFISFCSVGGVAHVF